MPEAMSEFVTRARAALADHSPSGDARGRPSAVMLVLFPRDGVPHLILTKRTDHLHHHPGQIALPGGRPEPEDDDLLATALRETQEEVGIGKQHLEILGRLDDVHTLASDFLITPWVGVADPLPQLVPDQFEIARVMEVPVAELIAADSTLPPSPDIRSLRYPLDGEDVWGATARVLRCFCAVVGPS